jgi:hypothetical protein
MRIDARASVRAAFRLCDALTITSMLPGAGRKYHQSHFASRCHMARFKWRYVTKRPNRPRFPRYFRHGARPMLARRRRCFGIARMIGAFGVRRDVLRDEQHVAKSTLAK